MFIYRSDQHRVPLKGIKWRKASPKPKAKGLGCTGSWAYGLFGKSSIYILPSPTDFWAKATLFISTAQLRGL